MYFLDIKALKKQLVSQGLTQRQLFYYILINVVLFTITVERVQLASNGSPNAWDFAGAITNILIMGLGTFALYRANGGDSGTQFAARFFSIWFVGTIHFWLFSILFSLVWFVVASFFPSIMSIFFDLTMVEEGRGIQTTGYLVVLGFVYSVLLFVYIGKHIRDVARATSSR